MFDVIGLNLRCLTSLQNMRANFVQLERSIFCKGNPKTVRTTITMIFLGKTKNMNIKHNYFGFEGYSKRNSVNTMGIEKIVSASSLIYVWFLVWLSPSAYLPARSCKEYLFVSIWILSAFLVDAGQGC